MLRMIDRSDPADSLSRILDQHAWGSHGSLHASRILSLRWRMDTEAAEELLARQLRRYPVDPTGWMLRANVAFSLDLPAEERAAHLASAVASQPGDRNIQWQAAMIALRGGDRALAERHLKLAARARTRETGPAMVTARRWIADPDELLDRVVPDTEAHLTEAMRQARQLDDLALARAIWQRVDHPRQPQERLVRDFLGLALDHGDHALLTRAWANLDPRYQPGDFPVGDIHLPLESMPAFGWRTRMPAGVRLSRELVSEAPWNASGSGAGAAENDTHALRLTFDGNENIRFRHLMARFPILEPGHYRLQGWWRGEQLTTRSLPWLHASLRREGWSERLDTPSRNFPWQPFELELKVTEANEVFALRVRRDPTDAFDRYIQGNLWLGNLTLEHLGPIEPQETLPAESSHSYDNGSS